MDIKGDTRSLDYGSYGLWFRVTSGLSERFRNTFWGNTGVTLGFSWGYTGIMEKNMETTL